MPAGGGGDPRFQFGPVARRRAGSCSVTVSASPCGRLPCFWKSVAAFANRNDGAIFVGIDDAGHIKGLRLDFTQKNRLEQKIHQLVRARIKPAPPVQITFEELRGLVIARIAVAKAIPRRI